MKTLLLFSTFLHLLGPSRAVYKQWIPNTNFENPSNWDQVRVPCTSDVVVFGSSEMVSVFVQSPHSLTDMYLPLNGEFILAPGAGLAAFDGNYEAGCETASEIKFTGSGSYQWYNPTLWQAAASLEDLERDKYMFSVDEERVPCQYDDVLFQPETSFRVNIESSEQMIRLRSLSIMGQKFTDDDTLAEYMKSRSAKLQFHGQGAFRLSNARCPDKSGCECGNAAGHHRICAALLQNSEGQCPVPTCKNPLKPVGHCCEICVVNSISHRFISSTSPGSLNLQGYMLDITLCNFELTTRGSKTCAETRPHYEEKGTYRAIISLEYSTGFDIELYRDRIHHTFLSLPKNAGVQMAVSKVRGPSTFLGLLPRSSASLIQITLMDNRTGSQSGTHAEQLAEDIMNDIAEHGESFGIVRGSLHAATGNNWGAQEAGPHVGATATGMVIVSFLILLILGIVLFLYKKGILRSFPCVHLLSRWKRMNDLDSVGEAVDKGFDNPMFDTPSSFAALEGACSMEDTMMEMGGKNTQVYYINPLYDETELRA